jgi:hypothetical protein
LAETYKIDGKVLQSIPVYKVSKMANFKKTTLEDILKDSNIQYNDKSEHNWITMFNIEEKDNTLKLFDDFSQHKSLRDNLFPGVGVQYIPAIITDIKSSKSLKKPTSGELSKAKDNGKPDFSDTDQLTVPFDNYIKDLTASNYSKEEKMQALKKVFEVLKAKVINNQEVKSYIKSLKWTKKDSKQYLTYSNNRFMEILTTYDIKQKFKEAIKESDSEARYVLLNAIENNLIFIEDHIFPQLEIIEKNQWHTHDDNLYESAVKCVEHEFIQIKNKAQAVAAVIRNEFDRYQKREEPPAIKSLKMGWKLKADETAKVTAKETNTVCNERLLGEQEDKKCSEADLRKLAYRKLIEEDLKQSSLLTIREQCELKGGKVCEVPEGVKDICKKAKGKKEEKTKIYIKCFNDPAAASDEQKEQNKVAERYIKDVAEVLLGANTKYPIYFQDRWVQQIQKPAKVPKPETTEVPATTETAETTAAPATTETTATPTTSAAWNFNTALAFGFVLIAIPAPLFIFKDLRQH